MPKQPSPFQTLYRVTVMSGVLVVGSMAAYRYGPPPEQLASMIDSTVERVDELLAEFPETASLSSLGAAESTVEDHPISEAAPVWPAYSSASMAPPPLSSAATEQGVVVEPLGGSGLAYRASGSAAGPGGLIRHFDAIGETPEQAELAVLDKMSAARRGG